MAKRKETLMLEEILHKETRESRIYGCEEITIGFYNSGHGNEVVDFMTMDSKGIIRCYELKVTMADLKSNAKKSWYGHYNYLVTTSELWDKIKDNIDDYIPSNVGVFIGCCGSLKSVKKCQKVNISIEQAMMLKESMIRSMFYKMLKYKDAVDPEKTKALNCKVREAEKAKKSAEEYASKKAKIIDDFETYYFLNTGKDISLKDLAEKEKAKWKENHMKKYQ